MSVPDLDVSSRRVLAAGLLAGALVAGLWLAVFWSRIVLSGRPVGGAAGLVFGLLVSWVLSTASYAPFLVALLFVVAAPSGRTVAGGAALVYVVGLLLAVGQTLLNGVPFGLDLTVLAVPLPQVVSLLGVATAVWLGHHGGYDRLATALGNPDQHPVFAAVADEPIGPALSLQRGLVSAGLGALVTAGGLVTVGVVGDALRSVSTPGFGGGTAVEVSWGAVQDVGIPLVGVPERWLVTASLLLAVLVVTGPRLGRRQFLVGLGAIYGVQASLQLLPALFPGQTALYLFADSGPLFGPLADALLFSGVAVAVWLARHGGLAALPLSGRARPRPTGDSPP
ncbi:hypothetical protein ACKVMT_17315 [Halobacteriales archaeon Cl-PHB]